MFSRSLALTVRRRAYASTSRVAHRKPVTEQCQKRTFSEAAAKEAPPSPPPPPPNDAPPSGGGGSWLMILAAAGGAGYYYQDEIKKFVGVGDDAKVNGDLKKEVEDLGTKVALIEKKASKKPEKSVPVAAPASPTPPAVKKAPVAVSPEPVHDSNATVDYKALRLAIAGILEQENYDDGSLGPLFVRLAWHNAGTFNKHNNTGGSEGARMRFTGEADWGANAGLHVARAYLEPIKAQFPGVTYSDLWSLAGTVAMEEMGGPEFKWRPGRKDLAADTETLPDGLLPDADGRDKPNKPADHLRDIFGRMGFNDKEIVALSGAHALGRCHPDRSGFWGPWTRAPTTFSNEYFRILLEERWSQKKTHEGKDYNGPVQFEDKTGDLMMLPTDMSLVWDDKMRKHVEEYAKNEELFFKDFAAAWIKLQELGVKKFHGRRRYWLFGPRE